LKSKIFQKKKTNKLLIKIHLLFCTLLDKVKAKVKIDNQELWLCKKCTLELTAREEARGRVVEAPPPTPSAALPSAAAAIVDDRDACEKCFKRMFNHCKHKTTPVFFCFSLC
jgi:hypothetical protein